MVLDGTAADRTEVDNETVTAGDGIADDLDLRPRRVVVALDEVDAGFAVGLGVHQVLVQLEASAEEESEAVSEAADEDPVCDAVS